MTITTMMIILITIIVIVVMMMITEIMRALINKNKNIYGFTLNTQVNLKCSQPQFLVFGFQFLCFPLA